MKKFSLVEFSVKYPWIILSLTFVITIAFLTQFPKMKIDTNPKNMLPATSDVRVWNDEVDKTFSLYEDTIVLGIVNEKGILNEETLGKIRRITNEVLTVRGVAARDVSSFTTIDNVTVKDETLTVAPLMSGVPKTGEEMTDLRKTLFENPLFINRIISKDGTTTAIYIPLEKGANGKEIADRLREIVRKEQGDEKYYVAGDPVARDTFGAVMFKLMGIFSPIAALIMFLTITFMFRNIFLSFSMMMVAMISIIWSLGLLIGLGFPVHIMSSMSPVFLMAIATDSIHIFNEFYFQYREKKNKRAAIIETMNAVSRPVRFTALATAAAFGVLFFMHIIPVKVFGVLIAFGTVVLRILSFSLIPALLTFVSEKKVEKGLQREDAASSRRGRFLRALGGVGAYRPKTTVAVVLILLVVAIIGTTRIVINNNMVDWFKKSSEVRVSDTVMNRALGGTSLGYVVALSDEEDYIKTPKAMKYIEGLQRHLEQLSIIGKTVSVADYVKRINRVLHNDDPAFDAIPDDKDTIGQYLFLFSMSAKPADLDNVVDYPFQKANIWVQIKTWNAQAMRDVIAAVEDYKRLHPTPMAFKPAGTAYFNLVWNNEVLYDMLKGFLIALVVVFVILAFNFRSIKWAIIGYIPLLFTILLIYGVVGITGKDFDMPISVLSALSLGMAVDFAIHFVSRFKQKLADADSGETNPLHALSGEEDSVLEAQGFHSDKKNSSGVHSPGFITEALLWTAVRPGRGIMRNAFLFAAAFSVMLFAPLTPYITVGAFIVSMMMLSSIMTILFIPALVTLSHGWLFRKVREEKKEVGYKMDKSGEDEHGKDKKPYTIFS